MRHLSMVLAAASLALGLFCGTSANAQEFRHRQDRMCTMLKAKFDAILPKVMRENYIDDIVLTDDGARFVYPPISHILLVH